jgi:tetratricopeptide (TPR) repeat protein
MGWHSRGASYAARSIGMAKACDDKLELGRSYCYKGIALFAAAKYGEGAAALSEAIETLARTGDLFEVNLAHFHKACCHYGSGDLAQAVEEARTAFEGSIRIGEDTRAHCAIFLWAKATGGGLPFEQLRSCFRAVPEDILSTDHLLMAEGFWHSFHGRTEESLAAFQRAYKLAAQHCVINFHTAEAFPLLAMALRRHADAVEDRDPRCAQQLRRRAGRWAKWAARLTRFFPAFRPHALREWGLALAGQGRPRRALRMLDKSCAAAQRQSARYEYARSLLERGKVAQALGLSGAGEQIAQAEAELRAIEGALSARAFEVL